MKAFPNRGDLYLVSLDPTIGSEINKTRPAVIISNDINNRAAKTVTVVPITSQSEKLYPFEATVASDESGLSKPSKVKCNQIRTIDRRRLVKRLGTVSKSELEHIENALLIHLDMYFDNHVF